ncbi:MAG: hypothetical protein IH588_19410 [Anaerolineales bacterium]|nr:hypothetical protein [Anaerolineales bacterium]
MVEQDAAVALFESLRVTFEDVEEFLDKSVVVPDEDVAIPHISGDGDVFVFRGSGLFISSHVLGGESPLSAYYTTS